MTMDQEAADDVERDGAHEGSANEAGESTDQPAETGDASRRGFIKKLPYVAPAIQTFLMSEGVLASGEQRGNQKSQRRTQRGVSPNPGKAKPPPPPPADDG